MERTHWYKDAVVYQVYPFSFMDSDNDGMGDIPGIISKLDYIRDLGVTAIWFSPLYESPLKDYGYDIQDYRSINHRFGTMEDFDLLLEECHKRGLKVIMDMVLNHTSDQHEWFRKAIADPESPYRDYYIIRPGRRKGKKLLPPTNWNSTFTGSAWERIAGTDDFYLHLFCVEQPDLNWENEQVRREIEDILDFWLDKGVDGFRFDVFNMFSKVYPLQDDTSGSSQKGSMYFIDGPRIHEFLHELYETCFSGRDTFTVGESYQPSEEHAVRYAREESEELDAIFNFRHLESDNIGGLKFFRKPFDLRQFKEGLIGTQTRSFDGGWNTLVLENHDNPRCVCRFGIDWKHYRYEAATFLAAVTYLGFGTPFLYMGQEIGCVNVPFRSIDEMKDPVSHFVYDLMTGYGMPKKLALSFIRYGARDHSRVPMPWDGSVNGGFNRGADPWQCVNPSYDRINVENDLASERSVYRFYQKVLRLRKENGAAVYGTVKEYDRNDRHVIAYAREKGEARFFVVGNFSSKNVRYSLPGEIAGGSVKLLLSNYEDARAGRELSLRPYEAMILEY